MSGFVRLVTHDFGDATETRVRPDAIEAIQATASSDVVEVTLSSGTTFLCVGTVTDVQALVEEAGSSLPGASHLQAMDRP